MVQKTVTLLLLFFTASTAAINPKLSFDFAISPLFPGSQKIYNVSNFIVNDNGLENDGDTLVYIKDILKYMVGYSVGGKIGEVTPLNLGIRLKFEHFFNRYFETHYNEMEGEIDTTPIDIQLFTFAGGLYSSLKIANTFGIEPDICFLLVRSLYEYHLKGYASLFRYGVNKPGIATGLKLAYIKPDKINFGTRFTFIYYAEIIDFSIGPFLEVYLSKKLQLFSSLKVSFSTNAINPAIGVRYSLF